MTNDSINSFKFHMPWSPYKIFFLFTRLFRNLSLYIYIYKIFSNLLDYSYITYFKIDTVLGETKAEVTIVWFTSRPVNLRLTTRFAIFRCLPASVAVTREILQQQIYNMVPSPVVIHLVVNIDATSVNAALQRFNVKTAGSTCKLLNIGSNTLQCLNSRRRQVARD